MRYSGHRQLSLHIRNLSCHHSRNHTADTQVAEIGRLHDGGIRNV
jgi:hypothetical protein